MPQPIHYRRLIQFDFNPRTISQYPYLAAHIAVINGIWNEIDGEIASFLTALLGSEAKTGISIYFAITNDGAKRATFDTICKMKLSKTANQKLSQIINKIYSRYKDRNVVVHGAWGTSPHYRSKLLWADMREIVQMHVDLLEFPGDENQDRRDEIMLNQQKKLMVWKSSDFEDVESRLNCALDELKKFIWPFMLKTYAPIAKVQ